MDSLSQMDNSSQTEQSSIDKSKAADDVVATHLPEYERYLELQRIFHGPAHKALVRKRAILQ